MSTLITLHEVEYPPLIKELDLLFPDDTTTTTTTTTTKEWTYGGYLLHPCFAQTSPTLRRLVARCLISNPTRRPDMHTLEATIRRHVCTEGGPVTDAERRRAQAWAVQVFGGPAPPPPAAVALKEEGEGEGGKGGMVGVRLRGPGEDLVVRTRRRMMRRMGPEEEGRMREVNRVARRVPGARMLVGRFARGFVKGLF
jgi:hypothetical protein